jgi:dTDP-4-amino-4,6-dideoxygalactose transaminase
MKIPFMSLKESMADILPEIKAKISEVIANTAFINGPEIKAFEKEFASYAGLKKVVGCSNGTDALIVALKVLGVGPGDKVIVPANSFIATAEAVSLCGAEVVYMDVLEKEWTLDPQALEEYFAQGGQATAVIPVHLYGRLAQMEKIAPIVRQQGAYLVEDCAQGHGATRQGHPAGYWGDLVCFSFFPGKTSEPSGTPGPSVPTI